MIEDAGDHSGGIVAGHGSVGEDGEVRHLRLLDRDRHRVRRRTGVTAIAGEYRPHLALTRRWPGALDQVIGLWPDAAAGRRAPVVAGTTLDLQQHPFSGVRGGDMT